MKVARRRAPRSRTVRPPRPGRTVTTAPRASFTARRPPAVAPTARQARGLEAATLPAPSASSTFTLRVGAVVSLVPR